MSILESNLRFVDYKLTVLP